MKKTLSIILASFFCFICAIPLLPTSPLCAGLNHHVIILIDRSASMKKGGEKESIQQIQDLIRYNMADLCFKAGEIIPGRKLLDSSKRDFLSVVSFGLTKTCPDFNAFIQPISEERMGYYRYRKDFVADTYNFSHLWETMGSNNGGYTDFFHCYWSSISMAIPAALYDLRYRAGGEGKSANRTYVLLITDEAYNDLHGYPVEELNYLKKQNFKDDSMCFRGISDARNWYEAVQTRYTWRECKKVSPQKIGRYFLRIFEVLPLTRNFAIESLISFGNEKVKVRSVNGRYIGSISLNGRHVDDVKVRDGFSITKIEFCLEDGRGNKVGETWVEPIESQYISKRLDFQCNSTPYFQNKKEDYGQIPLFLSMKFWVHMKDDAYGIQELSPYAPVEYGSPGLKRIVAIYVEEPKTDWKTALLDWGEDEGVANAASSDEMSTVDGNTMDASEVDVGGTIQISYTYNNDGKRVEKEYIRTKGRVNSIILFIAIVGILTTIYLALPKHWSIKNSDWTHRDREENLKK